MRLLKIHYPVLWMLLAVFFFACQPKTSEPVDAPPPPDQQRAGPTGITAKNTAVTYIPETKNKKIIDTLISEKHLRIVVSEQFLDTYIPIEYSAGGINHIDRYRDAEIHVVVEQNSKEILDTIFTKESLLPYPDTTFLNDVVLFDYWFNKIEGHQIEFFGSIVIPESDIGFFFYHFLNLQTGELRLEEHHDKEE